MFDRKEYMKQWHLDHKEEQNEKCRQWYLDHKETASEQKHQWYLGHKEIAKERAKQWNLDHIEEIKEYHKQYYLVDHPEYNKQWRLKHPKYFKQWNQNHRGEIAKYDKKYNQTPKGKSNSQRTDTKKRAREREMINTLTSEEWLDILKAYNYRCAYCGKEFDENILPTKDHVLPISKGGNNIKENVVPACRSCNAKKSNKISEQFQPVIKILGKEVR